MKKADNVQNAEVRILQKIYPHHPSELVPDSRQSVTCRPLVEENQVFPERNNQPARGVGLKLIHGFIFFKKPMLFPGDLFKIFIIIL